MEWDSMLQTLLISVSWNLTFILLSIPAVQSMCSQQWDSTAQRVEIHGTKYKTEQSALEWISEISKSITSDTVPPTRPYLLIVPLPGVQEFKSMSS